MARLGLEVSVMQIYNSVSFGAYFNSVGNKVVKDAKVLASYRNYEKRTDDYTEILQRSLETIGKFMPGKKFDVEVKNNEMDTDKYFTVYLDGEPIYKDTGDELNFINYFANAIKTGRVK